jgi:trehalose-6-phosphatase
MDQYLVPNSNLLRLLKEYHKYGSLCIAFDFDNTVYDYHHEGVTYNMVINLLKELKQINCYLTVFTANEDLEFVENYLMNNRIPFDGINCNPPFYKGNSIKPYYNALLDDRAGLIQVYQELSLLLKII